MRSHEQAVMRIGRYLLSSKDKGMIYAPDPKRGLEVWQALRETIPLVTLMREMNEIFPLYLPQPRFVIKVWEDNQSCIAMAENPKFTPRTKHIPIKYHHFRKHVITQANPIWVYFT